MGFWTCTVLLSAGSAIIGLHNPGPKQKLARQAEDSKQEENPMLSDARYETSLPCSDLERARSFYADKLGLTPASEQSAGAFYEGRDGTRFILFPSSGSAAGSHSQMGFMVADIDAEVRDLKQRGVQRSE